MGVHSYNRVDNNMNSFVLYLCGVPQNCIQFQCSIITEIIWRRKHIGQCLLTVYTAHSRSQRFTVLNGIDPFLFVFCTVR